jgi:hypothetical protein
MSTGPARLLRGVYTLFAIAAAARSGYQLATKLADAPLAYLLSALAAALYVVAALALRTNRRGLLAVAAGVELAGVLAVGLLTLADPGAFPDETVWSHFGQGYGFLPLVLPIAALVWLRYDRSPATAARARTTRGNAQGATGRIETLPDQRV